MFRYLKITVMIYNMTLWFPQEKPNTESENFNNEIIVEIQNVSNEIIVYIREINTVDELKVQILIN